MSHYVGDACQPLHISALHHGREESESGVHSDYETTMIDKKMPELFAGVAAAKQTVKKTALIGPAGIDAARLVLRLMKEISDRLPPSEVVDVWTASAGRGKYDAMWQQLGERTCENIAAGSLALAILWQSAWTHGGGAPKAKLKKISQAKLQALYNDANFVASFKMSETEFKDALTL